MSSVLDKRTPASVISFTQAGDLAERRGPRPRVAEMEEVEAIRAEVARELHDRVAQTLTTLLLEMEHFKALQHGRAGVLREVDGYQSATREVLNDVRSFLLELRGRPSVAGDFVAWLRGRLERFGEQSGIGCTLSVSPGWPAVLPALASGHLRRIVDEALQNLRLHSGASEVHVRLGAGPRGEPVLTICDNGRGLENDQAPEGLGLMGMRERALLMGATFALSAGSPTGTVVEVRLPEAYNR